MQIHTENEKDRERAELNRNQEKWNYYLLFYSRSKRPSVTKSIDYLYIYIAIGIPIFIEAAATGAAIVATTFYFYRKNTQSSSINFKSFFFVSTFSNK